MGLFDGLNDIISSVGGLSDSANGAIDGLQGQASDTLGNVTEGLNVDEQLGAAGDAVSGVSDSLNGAADGIQEAIPGPIDDHFIDGAQNSASDSLGSIGDIFGGFGK